MKELKNTDLNELKKFSSRADDWWNVDGDFKTLHDINSTRLKFITKNIKLKGLNVLDIGCGGGILTESIAKKGAFVTGIDMSEKSINIATEHALKNDLEINYFLTNIEEFSKKNKNKFGLITCMELLEHVPDPLSIIEASKNMIKKGGHIVFSTINRNIKSYVLAIIGAEYLFKLLPKGTHRYEKFIMPSELIHWCNLHNLKTNDLSALKYNPLLKTCSLSGEPDVNYILDVIADD